MYCKCIIALALVLASAVDYNRMWWHNLEHHLQSSLTIVIYDRNIFIIQATKRCFTQVSPGLRSHDYLKTLGGTLALQQQCH